MNDMKIFEMHEGIEFLVNGILSNTVVPVIGAGFTAGSKASNGEVPDGKTLKDIMRNCIKEHSAIYTDIDNLTFKELSEIFFDAEEVPASCSLKLLKDLFTGVKLPKYKISFLECWKYIYTINIDDAIEKKYKFYCCINIFKFKIRCNKHY